jgi:hypothetical protein
MGRYRLGSVDAYYVMMELRVHNRKGLEIRKIGVGTIDDELAC